MKFDKYFPSSVALQTHVKYFVISEMDTEAEYKVLPTSGLVIGFQYKGRLTTVEGTNKNLLNTAGITGISDGYKIFQSSANTGTVLIYFSETGFRHFASHPAHELLNLSLPLDFIFDKNKVAEVEEKLSNAITDTERLQIVERFLISQLKDIETDKLIVEAVKLIYQSSGTIRVKELNQKLNISQSPFEKRFRRVVGTSPKKFSSIVRFNTVTSALGNARSLTELCYDNGFFDQSHFIKDFRKFTGVSPEEFRNSL